MSESKNNSEITEASEVQDLTFADLELLEPVQEAIESLGYQHPTPIQAKSIPYLMSGKDILAVAQTGTGKTAAFALPLLSRIDPTIKKPQILVLAPTRELAIQVAEAFGSYAKNIKGFKVLPIYGGQDYRTQLNQLERGVQVVVGTPGRVMDHIRRKTLDLTNMRALVLDEADEMLRMGFIDDVEWVLQQMPEGHQTALFSATMPQQIRRIANSYLNDPAEVMIKVKTTTAETITQRYLSVKGFEKADVLCRILESEEFDAAIVFVRTKNATIEVVERLQAEGFRAEALNGDIAQNQREKTVNQIKNGRIDILVATDVAARGLDVERISHVINYDVPFDTESYVHRIGRTGRAGRQGDAILFITGRERNMLGQIERATKQKIADYEFPSLDVLNGRKIAGLLENINKQLDADISEYEKLVKDLLETSDLSTDDLLLGFISLVQAGKPFYAKPYVASPNVRGKERSDNRKPRDRDERGGRGRERAERGERGPKKAYNDIDLTRYRLAVGEDHGVQKGDIVGAIANEAGISSGKMGKIHLRADHSFIDLPNDLSSDTVNKLKNVFIRGQKINLQASDEAMAPAADKGKKRDGNKRFDNTSTAPRRKDAAPKSAAKKRDNNDAAPKQRRRKPKPE